MLVKHMLVRMIDCKIAMKRRAVRHEVLGDASSSLIFSVFGERRIESKMFCKASKQRGSARVRPHHASTESKMYKYSGFLMVLSFLLSFY